MMRAFALLFALGVASAQIMPPEVGYFTIKASGRTTGAAGYKLGMASAGWELSGWTILKAKAGATRGTLRIKYTADLDPYMRLRQYSLDIDGRGSIVARWSNGKLTVEGADTSKAKGNTASLECPNPPYLLDLNCFSQWAIVAKQVRLRGREGVQRILVFSPQTGKLVELSAQVGHTEPIGDRTAYKVAFSAPGVDAIAMIDSANSRLLRLSLPTNEIDVEFESECPDTTALATMDIAEQLKVNIPPSKIKCEGEVENSLEIGFLRAKLVLSLDAVPRTKTTWQRFEGTYQHGELEGEVEVEVKPFKGKGSWRMDQLEDLPDELRVFVETAPDVPAHNDVVQRIADGISAETVWSYICRANRWVADNVKHEANQPNPLVAAAERKGDPLAKARLLAALLRSKNIPARVVGGIYYFGQIWVPHYWVEAWVSPSVGWRPTDPSTGEDVNFSAMHITLFEGKGSVGSGRITILKTKKR